MSLRGPAGIRFLVDRHPTHEPHQAPDTLLVHGVLCETFDPAAINQALANRDAKGFSDWKTFSLAAIEGTGIDRYKRDLSAHTAGGLAMIVGPLLDHLGYEVPNDTPRRDTDALRRRYLAGLALQGLK